MQSTQEIGLINQYSSENIKSLGIKRLNIPKNQKQSNWATNKRIITQTKTINLIKLKNSENYSSFFWEKLTFWNEVKSFSVENSIPCTFFYTEKLNIRPKILEKLWSKRSAATRLLKETVFEELLALRYDKQTVKTITPQLLKITPVTYLMRTRILRIVKRDVVKNLLMHINTNIINNKTPNIFQQTGLIHPTLTRKVLHRRKSLKVRRFKIFYDVAVYKDYFKALARGKLYPLVELSKRTVMLSHIGQSKKKTTARKFILEQSQRHPIGQFKQLNKYLITTISSSRFEKWGTFKKKVNYYIAFYKMVWRYFKLKIERFFFKQLGVRMHIWFMNIWDIFLTGIDSYWQWFKFEDQKIFAMTRKGQRYLIEKREEAKFYLRSMVLTLTLGGGVKLYIDKVTVLLKQYRNNWAFITHTMESLRLCANFFWFRFFLNYKVTLQGKIGGMLRAEKKTFKKGNVSIEDRSTIIAYHRTFPRTKFGVYCLGFWLQYRVPNLIGTFNEMEFIDTMRVLLSMYTIPWLSSRLTEIIEAILREKEIKDQLRFNQYVRRQKARGILSTEFKTFMNNNRSKIKVKIKGVWSKNRNKLKK